MKLKSIESQVVVVMGASSGIGRETALRFARRGAAVVAAARDEEGLRSLVDEIRSAGGEAAFVVADTADFDAVQTLAETAARTYGRIDTWVQVAAVALWATIAETTPEEFRRVMEVDLLGQVWAAKAAVPHLVRSGGGAFIAITSAEARRGLPYQAAYAAAKHGAHGFLDVLRMELHHAGAPVSVTEIMPATINTPLFNKSRTKIGTKPMGLPPAYPPALVADAILHAAEHPVRDWVAGGSGHLMLASERLSPRLTDLWLGALGFRGQRSAEPKDADAPDNLFAPLPGHDRVDGDFRRQAALVSGARLVQGRGWLALVALAGTAFWLARRRT